MWGCEDSIPQGRGLPASYSSLPLLHSSLTICDCKTAKDTRFRGDFSPSSCIGLADLLFRQSVRFRYGLYTLQFAASANATNPSSDTEILANGWSGLSFVYTFSLYSSVILSSFIRVFLFLSLFFDRVCVSCVGGVRRVNDREEANSVPLTH